MRATVLALDGLIYVPALFMFVRTWLGSRSRRTQVSGLSSVEHPEFEAKWQESSSARIAPATVIIAG
jgi:hypothetical protein